MATKKELQAKLPEDQQLAALLLVESKLSLDPDVAGMTIEEIADRCHVTRQTVHRWKKQKAFIQYQNLIAQEFLASFETEVYAKLIHLVRTQESVKPIETYAKLRNLIKTTHVVETVETVRSDDDIKKEMEELESLLSDEVLIDESEL